MNMKSLITNKGYPEAIAAAVRAEFGRQGYSASKLGEAIGRSRPTAYARWHGTLPYQAGELDKVAEFLGISVFDLHDSARLASGFGNETSTTAEVRETPQQDDWAQPARSRVRRAS